jgi:hypothetical protein
MSVTVFILGVACLLTGVVLVARREAIVSRHLKRAPAEQAPAAYAVMGGILGLLGVVLVLAGLL